MSSCLHGAAHTKGVATEQRSSLILQESFLGTEKWCNKLHCPFVLLAAWVLDALMCEGSCIFAVSPSHGSCSLSPSAPLQRSASCSAQTKCLHGGRVPTVQNCILITPVKKADLESIPRIPHSGLHCCMAVISFHLTSSHAPKQHQQSFSFRLENAVQSALLEHLEAKSLKREQQSQSLHSVKPSPRKHVIQNMCVSEQS
jgi:hypothetical protein